MAESDLDEVRTLINKYQIVTARVLLMPEGAEREKVPARGRWLAAVCKVWFSWQSCSTLLSSSFGAEDKCQFKGSVYCTAQPTVKNSSYN